MMFVRGRERNQGVVIMDKSKETRKKDLQTLSILLQDAGPPKFAWLPRCQAVVIGLAAVEALLSMAWGRVPPGLFW
jgi:hypothetical protein